MSNCFVYILFSTSLNRYYIGHTCDTLDNRIAKHLQSTKGFTAKAKDWVLVYHETFSNKSGAYKRERQLKSWKSRTKIEALIAAQS